MPWKMTAVARVTIRGKVRMRVTINPLINPSIVPNTMAVRSASQTGSPHSVIIIAMIDADQRHLIADRQVDSPGDQHEGETDGHDDEVGVLGDDVGEVADREELRVGDREEHDQAE